MAVIVILVTMTFATQIVFASNQTETPIKHVVIIIQENHTFFNYWASYPGVIGGISDATCQQFANGTTVCPYETNDPISTGPLNHSGETADVAYSNGSMNQFLVANKNDQVMSYYNASVLGYYYGLAEHYTLNDMFFSSYMSYSLPNHWAAVAGDSPAIAITESGKTLSTNASTSELIQQASQIETMIEAVQKPITVRYYDAPIEYSSLTRAIRLGGDSYVIQYWNPSSLKADAYTTLRKDFVNRTNILSDVANGKLPSISWVIPNVNDSEHPPNSVVNGEQWVQTVVDAIMNSKYWSSTAIFIMTDDWGGFYDPVVPPTLPNISPGNDTGAQMELGFRVSALLVSPYANAGIVNTPFSFESILHFIDYNWNLPLLNIRVQDANNMLGDFNFHQHRIPPWLGTTLTATELQNVMYNANLNTPDVD